MPIFRVNVSCERFSSHSPTCEIPNCQPHVYDCYNGTLLLPLSHLLNSGSPATCLRLLQWNASPPTRLLRWNASTLLLPLARFSCDVKFPIATCLRAHKQTSNVPINMVMVDPHTSENAVNVVVMGWEDFLI